MKTVAFYALYSFLWLISLPPLRVLYLLSDVAYLIVYQIFRYRRKVVRENLRNAFPEKSDSERQQIERRFYHFLCDIAVESLRLLHMDETEIHKHVRFEELDLINNFALENRDTIAVMGHCGNWEWISTLPRFTDYLNISTIYKTLRNEPMDRFYRHLRSQLGTHCYARKQVLRGMVELRKLGQPFIMAFIADQTPSCNNLHIWTQFLNQETPFIDGWETIARKQNLPVLFLHQTRTKRGHYVFRVELLEANPSQTNEGELVERYAKMLETDIRQNPETWLWSHRRWKFKR